MIGGPLDLAYVDDEIDQGVPIEIVKALETLGHSVSPFKDGYSLLDAMRSGFAPDVIIADWELHSDEDSTHVGLNSALDVARDALREFGIVPIVVVTRFRGRVRLHGNLDPRCPTALLDKPASTSAVQRWVEGSLASELHRLVGQPSELHHQQASISALDPDLDFFDADPAALSSSGEEASTRSLRKRAFLATEQWTTQIFEGTRARWLAIARSEDDLVIARWGLDEDPTMTLGEVRRLESLTEHPVLVVSRPPRLEEIDTESWVECSYGEVSNDLYPSIGIELDDGDHGFHFDTGAVRSFIDYELLRGRRGVGGYSDLVWTVSRMSIRGRSQAYEYADCPTPEFTCPNGDGGENIVIPFQMVTDWSDAPVSLVCRQGACERSVQVGDAQFLCGRRRGLIGRDILRSNPEIKVTLDAATRRTIVTGPSAPKRGIFRRRSD